MGAYDLAFRQLATQCPEDFAWLVLGQTGLRIKEVSAALKAQRRDADFVARVETRTGERRILHVEFERKPNEPMGERLLEYGVALHLREGLPVVSCVMRMQKRGRRARDYTNMGDRLRFRYDEIGFLDMNAGDMLRSQGHPAFLALVPLCQGGDRREVLEEVVRKIRLGKFARTLRADLLAAMMVFAGTKPDAQELVRSLVRREDMKESIIYREIFEEGKVEGKVEGEAEAIVKVLEARFDAVPARLAKRLRAVNDPKLLAKLLKLAATCEALSLVSSALLAAPKKGR